jgi:hypothetical protein
MIIYDRHYGLKGASPTTIALLLAIALQIICGGMRFVDGSMLLQFSQVGFHAQLQDFSQYLFDSPLKVLLLHLFHLNSAMAIGFLFLALNGLPVLAIWLVSKNLRERQALLAIITIMPTWKITFQNIGVGDSVVISCTIILAMATSPWLVAATAVVVVLWHFQQGMLICLFCVALSAVCRDADWRQRAISIVVGAAVGVTAFAITSALLIPSHTGRAAVILSHWAPFLAKNFIFLPIVLCSAVPALFLMFDAALRSDRKERGRMRYTAVALSGLALCISLVTLDVSRVLLLLTLPIVLFLANPRAVSPAFIKRFCTTPAMLPFLALGVITPIYSWSGIDVYLWPTLLKTWQKYHGLGP